MGVIDRTPEFRQIVQELARKGYAPTVEGAQGPTPQSQSEINAWSAEIGTQIHQASLKVLDLRKMAKSKNIFNDKTSEIQDLTLGVKKDIQSLNQKIEALEAKAKGGGGGCNYQAHSANMVSTLKKRLFDVSKDFKEALEDRTKALEEQDKRRKLYSPGTTAASNPFGRNEPKAIGRGDDLEGGGGQSMDLKVQNSRVEAVQNVQRTIGELAQMFQKMAVMVTAQEEQIQRIDEDVNDTLHNVEQGQDHLLRYFHHISSNRWLIIKVFLILIFFVVFFVVFLA